MISFNDIKEIFSIDLKGISCVEIEFKVNSLAKYQNCWMGKMPKQDREKSLKSLLNEKNKKHGIYWFGLTSDGLNAYDYETFSDFSAAPVFDGKSLKDVWDDIEIMAINGCGPEWWINTNLQKC